MTVISLNPALVSQRRSLSDSTTSVWTSARLEQTTEMPVFRYYGDANKAKISFYRADCSLIMRNQKLINLNHCVAAVSITTSKVNVSVSV